ncbi:MAG TPA: hypothetical protein VKX16_03480 [Chloroflexota bacterium]|nr:hypothetical protein [Chloroflexota bacterium]
MAENEAEDLMLAELDVVVFIKSHDAIERVAERVFGLLRSQYQQSAEDESGIATYEASGLGFHGLLFPNDGEMYDPEFEGFQYGLEITSSFWCVELDAVDLEGPLSEYFARKLAFEMNVETATELLLETTEESEIFEIRTYRRNPQYRLDQAPTTPKVFVVESRQVEEPFEDEDEGEWEDGEDEDYEDDEEAVEELEREDRQ